MRPFKRRSPRAYCWPLAMLVLAAPATGSLLRGDPVEPETEARASHTQHSVAQVLKEGSISTKDTKRDRSFPDTLPLNESIANLNTWLDDRYCDKIPLTNGHVTWDRSQQTMKRVHTEKSEICGPKVLIIGAMKCGTNTIGHVLAKHPRVAINRCPPHKQPCNEKNFQGTVYPQLSIWEGNDMSFKRKKQPELWLHDFAQRLPWTDGVNNITIDKSPSYFNTLKNSETVQLAKQLFPHAKVVATVCNPSTRMYSEYEFQMAPKRLYKMKRQFTKYGCDMPQNFLDFSKMLLHCQQQQQQQQDIIDTELDPEMCDRILRSYLKLGEYAMHLKEWYDAYGQDNVLVLDMESDSITKVQRLLSHIGEDLLPPDEYPWRELEADDGEYYTNTAYAGRDSAFAQFPYLMEQLQEHYAPYNEVLAKMIGEDFPLAWNEDFNVA